MKKILVCLLIFITLISALSSVLAGGNAPYMVATVLYLTGETYDIIEGQFKCVDLTPCTYYAMHNWYNDEQDGAGYAGFQYKDGQTWTILSIWNTTTGYSMIEYAPPGSVSEPFDGEGDRKSTRLNSSHPTTSRMPSSA